MRFARPRASRTSKIGWISNGGILGKGGRMAQKNMKLGEEFSASVVTPHERPVTTTRHYIIGWAIIAMLLVAFGLLASWALAASDSVSLSEGFKAKKIQPRGQEQGQIGGVLKAQVIRDGKIVLEKSYKNQIINAGETALRDCFGGTGTPTCTTVQNFKYHGLGTSSTAIAETDTGCGTELTTQYNPDNTRATGSQTNNGANIYRTIGTNSVDATVTVQEFCLMSQSATGGGTMWTRILTGGISLVSGDSVQTTYDLTIESCRSVFTIE